MPPAHISHAGCRWRHRIKQPIPHLLAHLDNICFLILSCSKLFNNQLALASTITMFSHISSTENPTKIILFTSRGTPTYINVSRPKNKTGSCLLAAGQKLQLWNISPYFKKFMYLFYEFSLNSGCETLSSNAWDEEHLPQRLHSRTAERAASDVQVCKSAGCGFASWPTDPGKTSCQHESY